MAQRFQMDPITDGSPIGWTIETLGFKLPKMLDRAGYPRIAADVDLDKLASVLPAMKKRAWEMWRQGEALTGHGGLPLQPTPNLAAD